MMRTIIDLPEEQVKALDTYRKKERIHAPRRCGVLWEPSLPGSYREGLIFAAILPLEAAQAFERGLRQKTSAR